MGGHVWYLRSLVGQLLSDTVSDLLHCISFGPVTFYISGQHFLLWTLIFIYWECGDTGACLQDIVSICECDYMHCLHTALNCLQKPSLLFQGVHIGMYVYISINASYVLYIEYILRNKPTIYVVHTS